MIFLLDFNFNTANAQEIKDFLEDKQVYFRRVGSSEYPHRLIKRGTKNKPYLFRDLIALYNDNKGDNVVNNAKSPFVRGHRKKIFTAEEEVEIKQEFKSGIPIKEIARRRKTTPKTIRNYLKKP